MRTAGMRRATHNLRSNNRLYTPSEFVRMVPGEEDPAAAKPRREEAMRKGRLVGCAITILLVQVTALHVYGAASLCTSATSGCFDFVDVTVNLDSNGAPAVGLQFVLLYDPQILKFVSIQPGRQCHAASNFSLEFYRDVDEAAGRIFYATSVNPFIGDAPVSQPATVACVRFIPVGTALTDICVMEGVNPENTLIADRFGSAIPIANAGACPSTLGPPVLSCASVEVNKDCVCQPNTNDCGAFDTPCRSGVCNEETGRCDIVTINEGGACDDGYACTNVDSCVNGECLGSGCTLPSLCVEAEEECKTPQGTGLVRVVLGDGQPQIIGGQFSIQYDAANVVLVDAAPGSACDPDSPFTSEVFRIVDVEDGRIFFAVSVTPGEPGTHGPATLACLTFRLHGLPQEDVCLFADLNPFTTILAAENGDAVAFYNAEDCPTEQPAPIIACDNLCTPVPALAEWGIVTLALLLLVGAKIAAPSRSPGHP